MKEGPVGPLCVSFTRTHEPFTVRAAVNHMRTAICD
jgi:hypothetical protein